MGSFEAPDLSYGALAPLLIVLGAACVGVLVEAFGPRDRQPVQLAVALLGTVGGLVVGTAVADALFDTGIGDSGLFGGGDEEAYAQGYEDGADAGDPGGDDGGDFASGADGGWDGGDFGGGDFGGGGDF